MPVQTNARPGEDRPGADVKTQPDHHPTTTCPCCQRAEALAAMYAETVALTELERDEAQADGHAYRALAQEAVHALHRLTAERDRLTERLRQLLDELRALRTDERRAA